MINVRDGNFILLAITLISLFFVFLLPPIPQWSSYHQFADTRTIWGIPNFWNVVSNIAFFIVGILGLVALKREWAKGNFGSWKEVVPFFIIFLGLILTAFGSSYYHLAPDNERLVWDRIPMTLISMAVVSLALMERVNFKVGFWSVLPLIAFGIWSVWYWIWTESLGRGDLRPYGFVHFYSGVFILAILYLFPKSYPSTKSFLLLIFFYGISMIFEHYDKDIYQMSGIVSGHTLKHLIAAISIYWVVTMVYELELK